MRAAVILWSVMQARAAANYPQHPSCPSVSWIPWNLSFCYTSFPKKRLQMVLWHYNARVNSHQRWKQTRFRICFHLWYELTSTMNVTEWHVSWNSWNVLVVSPICVFYFQSAGMSDVSTLQPRHLHLLATIPNLQTETSSCSWPFTGCPGCSCLLCLLDR